MNHLQQTLCSPEYISVIFPALQRMLVVLIYTNHTGDAVTVKQAATDSFHCTENIFKFIAIAGFQCESLHPHLEGCLKFLCNLPSPFYSDRRFASSLFPALVACSYGNEHNLRTLKTEMDPSSIANFFSECAKSDETTPKSMQKIGNNPGCARFVPSPTFFFIIN